VALVREWNQTAAMDRLAFGGELRSMSTDPHTIGGSGQIENVRRKGSA
jgi:hypothetical protein